MWIDSIYKCSVEKGAGKDVGSKDSSGAVTHKLGEWLQQIQGITAEMSVQKSTILGTARIQT